MPTGTNVFTPTVPASNVFSNTDLNSLGSGYAAQFGHATTALIQRQLRRIIYDAAPQGYFDDLKILKMKASLKKNSDEFFYMEKVFGRNSVIATAAVAAGGSQVIPVTATSASVVSIDMILTYPDNSKGTIQAVDTTLNQLTVRAMSGGTLPAVVINDVLAILSPVAADGANSISTYQRLNTIERTNFIQLFARATRFGEVELFKYRNAGTTDYLENNKQEVLNQFRIDLSNCYWNGQMGEVSLSNGAKAKTMGGVFPTMVAAGSPNVSTTLANIAAAVEDLVLSTQFGQDGQTKFLYSTPRNLHALQQAYKRTLTRYAPNDMMANLKLNKIEMQGNDIVLVPVKRFEEPSCFPNAFAKRLILLDQESITPAELWGERINETPDRSQGTNLNTYQDFWVDGNMSIEFNNPLASGYVQLP